MNKPALMNMGVAQNPRARANRKFSSSIYPGAILVSFFEPQPCKIQISYPLVEMPTVHDLPPLLSFPLWVAGHAIYF